MSDEPKKSHHKPKNYKTVKTGHAIDAPPEHLGVMGKMCYQKVVQDLVDMGVADRADSRAIEAFASAYEEYRIARKVCMAEGYTYTTEKVEGKGENAITVLVAHKRPEVDIMNAAWTRMRSLLPELYLTTASRSKAPGDSEKLAKSTWDDLIPDGN